jgi:hypothetical protein
MTARIWNIGVMIVFFAMGYFFSDNRMAQEILTKQRISTPQEVFQFVIDLKVPAPAGSPVLGGQSFRELMARRDLWCDEGAVVLAVLAGQLGYQTRLVDLIGKDSGISHHTVLQVYEKESWVTYDFTNRRFGQAPEKTVHYDAISRIRAYPDWSHQFLLNNYFLRISAQKIRPWIYHF